MSIRIMHLKQTRNQDCAKGGRRAKKNLFRKMSQSGGVPSKLMQFKRHTNEGLRALRLPLGNFFDFLAILTRIGTYLEGF